MEYESDVDIAADRKRRAKKMKKNLQKLRLPHKFAKHAEDLKFLSNAHDSVCSQYVKHASNEFIDCCSEICLNYCRQLIPCTESQFAKLYKHRASIRYLARKDVPLKQRRTRLQNGSGIIAAIALPLIGSLLSGLIGRATAPSQ